MPKINCVIGSGKNRAEMKKIKILNARRTTCDQHGNNANQAKLKDVNFFEDNTLNLISIRMFFKEERDIGGNRKLGHLLKTSNK